MLVTGQCSTCKKETWVDSMGGSCRECEIASGDRWGHRSSKAENGVQVKRDK